MLEGTQYVFFNFLNNTYTVVSNRKKWFPLQLKKAKITTNINFRER